MDTEHVRQGNDPASLHDRPRLPPLRMGIVAKLLVWFTVLLLVYLATTTFILRRTQDVERLAHGIVARNYRVVEDAELMGQQLLMMLENAKRFEILEKEEYRLVYLETLEGYEATLHGLMLQGGISPGPWTKLHIELLDVLPEAMREDGRLRVPESLTRSVEDAPAAPIPLLPEETVNGWLTELSEVRQENRAMMHERLLELEARAEESERFALWGAFGTLVFGVLGGAFIIATLGRSLRALKRGINSVAKEGEAEPVRVVSSDELGQLAATFNNMAAQLKREEEMRSDFISMLSHEIRTPLTSVRESVNLIRQGVFGETNEKQRRFLEIAGQEAQRLSELLTRLMQVSSLESGEVPMECEELDAAQLARSTAERMEPTAQAKGVKLRLSLPAQDGDNGGAWVLADAGHVRQALLNLLGNAIKFSPEDGVVDLAVRTEGGAVFFCVADQGPGIPEDEQDFVFRKYYRAQGIRQTVDGAGLGLSISKRIVEAHGGRMWLSASPHGGSSFCFTLPSAAKRA